MRDVRFAHTISAVLIGLTIAFAWLGLIRAGLVTIAAAMLPLVWTLERLRTATLTIQPTKGTGR